MQVRETQHFKLAFVNVILVILFVGLSALLIYAVSQHIPNAPWIIGGGLLLVLLLYLFFAYATLYTEFTETHIAYRFSPFQSRNSVIEIGDISGVTVDSIDPIGEFGGYGIRKKSGTIAYILSPKTVTITRRNGHKIVLSIKDEEKLREYTNATFQTGPVAR